MSLYQLMTHLLVTLLLTPLNQSSTSNLTCLYCFPYFLIVFLYCAIIQFSLRVFKFCILYLTTILYTIFIVYFILNYAPGKNKFWIPHWYYPFFLYILGALVWAIQTMYMHYDALYFWHDLNKRGPKYVIRNTLRILFCNISLYGYDINSLSAKPTTPESGF